VKEQIKIRKRWLIDPTTRIEPSKKQKFQEEDDDFRNYLGNITSDEVEEMEEQEDLEEKQ